MASKFRTFLANLGLVSDFRAPRDVFDATTNALDLPWAAIEPVWDFLYPSGNGAGTGWRVKRVTAGQLAIFSTWWLESEVRNGGFEQYFYNSSGHYAKDALEGLRRIGATAFAAIVRDALAVFPSGEPPKLRDERIAALERALERSCDQRGKMKPDTLVGRRLDALDNRFFDLLDEPNALRRIQSAYVRSNVAQFFR